MTREELLEVIAWVKQSGQTTLYLVLKGLGEIPSEIGQLSNLTILEISLNQLTALPIEISKLHNLTALNLHSNQLKPSRFYFAAKAR